MPQKEEYYSSMKRLNLAARACFGLRTFSLGLLALILTTASVAQINGTPVSVTSPGFGGRSINGTRPSVTSVGPRGFTPNAPCCFVGGAPRNPNSSTTAHHHHHNNGFIGGGYIVPYYGYYDSGNDAAGNQPDDSYTDGRDNDQYNGGPTVFDRRGPGTERPPAPAPRAARENTQPEAPSESAVSQQDATPASDSPQTILVFKDGHQLEVANYAIVGSTLFDLTGGRRQKIALAELDLPATSKQNDDRGIDFQVPGTPEAN
jgi:hypothetical protein